MPPADDASPIVKMAYKLQTDIGRIIYGLRKSRDHQGSVGLSPVLVAGPDRCGRRMLLGLFGLQPQTTARVAGQWIGADCLPSRLVDVTRVRKEENGPGSVETGFCLPDLRSSYRRLQGAIGTIYSVLKPFGHSRFSLRQAARRPIWK
jgi:hypothetical protein